MQHSKGYAWVAGPTVFITSVAAFHRAPSSATNLRDTLLPRLITGQLRLPDAEAMVAEAQA